MSRTTVAFVRHGRTEWNRVGRLQGSSDIPLDDVGREQARTAARLLADETWSALVTSPLHRARQTAAVLGTTLGLDDAEVCDLLVERTYGLAEGLTREQALRQWPDGEFPGQEALTTVAARGRAALDAVGRRHSGGRVVVVAHGALIRAVLSNLSDAAVPRILNGGVATVTGRPGDWTVEGINIVRR